MADQWFVYKNQEQKGPYSIEELKGRIQSGEFRNTDLYWNENMNEWKPGNQLANLFSPTSPPQSAPRKRPIANVKGNSGIFKKVIVLVIVLAVLASGVYMAPKVFSGIGNLTDYIPFIGNDSSSDFVYFNDNYMKKALDVPFTELQGYYAGVAKYTKADNLDILADMLHESDVEYMNERLGKELICIMEAESTYIDIYTMLEGSTEDYEETLFPNSYEKGIFEFLESDSSDGFEATYTAKAVVLDGNNDYRIVGYFEILVKNPEGEIARIAMEYDAERGQP